MGFKAFRKGLICRGKQYEENHDYQESGAESCCRQGVMHYCDEPLDVWDYYPIVDYNGDFTEYANVESLGKVLSEESKRATNKLYIGNKLSFSEFIKTAIERIKLTIDKRIIYSGRSFNDAKISSTEDFVKTGNESDFASISMSGDRSKIVSNALAPSIAMSGYHGQIGIIGSGTVVAVSGDFCEIGDQGDHSKISISGNNGNITSNGVGAIISSSGCNSMINIQGAQSICSAIAPNSIAKGALGNWIVLAEWDRIKEWDAVEGFSSIPVYVKAGLIDGKELKPDTWYGLEDGEFKEIEVARYLCQ